MEQWEYAGPPKKCIVTLGIQVDIVVIEMTNMACVFSCISHAIGSPPLSRLVLRLPVRVRGWWWWNMLGSIIPVEPSGKPPVIFPVVVIAGLAILWLLLPVWLLEPVPVVMDPCAAAASGPTCCVDGRVVAARHLRRLRGSLHAPTPPAAAEDTTADG